MPISVLLALLTTLVPTGAKIRTPPTATTELRSHAHADNRMPVYLRAYAAQQSRRLAASRARRNDTARDCGGGSPSVEWKALIRPRSASRPAVIIGRLNNPAGAGIRGARVTIHSLNLTTTSSDAGRFELEIPARQLAAAEDLTISVSAIGYRPYRQWLTVDPGDSARVTLTLCRQTTQIGQIA